MEYFNDMEEEENKYEYKSGTVWHQEWVKICNNRKNYKEKYSVEQLEHFSKWIEEKKDGLRELNKTSKNNPNRSEELIKFTAYSHAFTFLYRNLKLAIEERGPDLMVEPVKELDKVKELTSIFFHHYYLEFLDDESLEVVKEFLIPENYNYDYELRFSNQFLTNKAGIIEDPKITIFKIDKAIVLQMNDYEGGEKLAFLKYQYTKFININERSISLMAFLEDLKKNKKISKPTYSLGKDFVELKIKTHKELDKPIKTNLSQKRIGLFYRLLAESSFSDSSKADFFRVLTISHISKDKKFPTFDYLERQTGFVKITTEDKVRLGHILTQMQNKLKEI